MAVPSIVKLQGFQTLEMSCLRWTGSSQKFYEEIPNEKKYHPYIVWNFKLNLANMASATASTVIQDQSLKSHFKPIWVLAHSYRALISSKNCIILEKLKDYSTNPSNWPYSGQGIADLNIKQHFFCKIIKALYQLSNWQKMWF